MSNDAHEQPLQAPLISQGAAMAHGCCGGYRPPAGIESKAQVIAFAKPCSDYQVDCAEKNSASNIEQKNDTLDPGALTRVRLFRGTSQIELAERLNVSQPNIAQIEQQADMLLSTLDRHIRALGGHLNLVAHFPNGSLDLKTQGTTE